ncbi:MAG: radical SAM protein, partial [Nanoarchaeota archaeon]|nr:radical SAM protein [Nanoarchaeota archaeon]
MAAIGIVKLSATESCFFKCRMCSSWKIIGSVLENPVPAYERFFSGLKPYKSKDASVNITGGEPLMNRDIPSIISAASRNGFLVDLNTNAYLLDKKT